MSEALKKMGFLTLDSVVELKMGGLPKLKELQSCGVYAITVPAGFIPSFIAPNDARKAGNVVRPWDLERLSEKWVENTDIVYFGLAGKKSRRKLRKRLLELLRHCKGKTTDSGPHTGGEILWQVRGYDRFTVWVLPTGDPPAPRKTEEKLIEQFRKKHGKWPFANRQP